MEKKSGTYRLADLGVQISSIYPHVHMFCKDYVYNGDPDIRIVIQQEHIDYERARAEKYAEKEGIQRSDFPPTYLEALAVHRALAEQLPDYDRMMMHGSALALDGQAVIFTAKSGTGKSTHARLWREQFGDRVTMINDDKPLLHITPEQVIVYGSPWAGKHFLSNNISAPLKAICFLERGVENKITRISAAEAFPMFLQQCYRPKGREALMKTMELLDILSGTVGLYRLTCNMDPEAAIVACRGIVEWNIPG